MRPLLLTAFLMTGCVKTEEPPDTGDTSDTGGLVEDDCGCNLVEEIPLTMDEISDAGFSAQELVDLAGGEHSSTLAWVSGGTAGLTVGVTDPTNPRYRRYEAGECSNDMYYFCFDSVAVDVTMTFATDDGAFAETWAETLALQAESEDYYDYDTAAGTILSVSTPLESVSGSFDPADHVDVSEFDRVDAYVLTLFSESGISGEVAGGGETTYPGSGGDDGAVSYTGLLFGTF